MRLDLFSDVGALTAALVDIESVSGNERTLVDAVDEALRALPHLKVDRDGDSLVARTTLGLPERVILAGHSDTVPVNGNLPSRIEGDRMYGCGTSDMKSGLAVLLRLAATVPAPNRDVTYVVYECEEVAAERSGLKRLAETRPGLIEGDFAVLLESTLAEIEGGCQGTMRIEVTARGERAHTARAWMGSNAIHSAAEILDVLRAYEPARPVVDGLTFHEGLNAVFIRGGVAGNVVPDECVVTINYRFAPDKSVAEAEAVLRELFAGFEVTVVDAAAGARPGLGHPAAAAFVTAITGRPDVAEGVAEGSVRPKLGWTDVARFSALGIPAVNCGPGDPALAHTKGEYVEIPRIFACEERMRTWLTK
ncbi:succinyl-diaminopimelate desuccinylase [Actinomadura scrupuli]|uniref:succinyl-diaminopimelate desuccinylase n=1 Tax=Actinomadura scrupuli TaxID=559629 RepID=UPI003D9822F0